MSKVILWTQDNCPVCERVKEVFQGQDVEEHHAEDLIQGQEKDVDAMAQLAMQDMLVPVVMVDGEFIPPEEILRDQAEQKTIPLCDGNQCRVA